MRLVVMLALALAGAAWAELPDPARFRAAFDEAWHLVRLGRQLEGRALLGNLASRLTHYEPATRYQFADRLAEALDYLRDYEGVERVHKELVETCVLESTHSTAAVEDLPREPRARGLQLCRLALALPPGAVQRRMLLRGALSSLRRAGTHDAESTHRMGLCHLELGQRDRALQLLRAAVAMEPHAAGPRLTLARLVLADGRAGEALGVLERGLEQGFDREGTNLLADVLRALGTVDPARARSSAAAWSGRSTDGRVMAPVWTVAAELAEAGGQAVEALAGYCRVITAEAPPAVIAAIDRLARAELKKGDAARHAAVAVLTAAVRADAATAPELLRVTGELALRDGDPRTAIAMYGAGLVRPQTRGQFEPLLNELQKSFRASKKFDLAAEVDIAFGPPKFSEPDKSYAVVQLGADRCAVDVAGGTIAGQLPSSPKLAQFATTIAQVLKEYPPSLVQKLRLWKFELTEAPIVAGQGWIGVADVEAETVHVNIDTTVTGPDDWRVALHHEIFHLIDHQDDGVTAKDASWRKLNRPGFLYTRDKTVACMPATSANGPPRPGFVNQYAESGEEEDKAVTFANMMVHLPVLDTRAQSDPVLLAKMTRIQQAMRQYLPGFDDKFWDAIRARAVPPPGATADASAAEE